MTKPEELRTQQQRCTHLTLDVPTHETTMAIGHMRTESAVPGCEIRGYAGRCATCQNANREPAIKQRLTTDPPKMTDADIDAITVAQWGKSSFLPAYRAYARAICAQRDKQWRGEE